MSSIEEIPASESSSTTQSISNGSLRIPFTHLMGAISQIVSPNVVITSADLHAIYHLSMWTFLNNHYVPSDGVLDGLEKLEKDSQIYITVDELVRICGIAIHPQFRQYLRNALLAPDSFPIHSVQTTPSSDGPDAATTTSSDDTSAATTNQ